MSPGLFLLGCIPVRLFLSFIAYSDINIKNTNFRIMLSIITFIIGLSFLVIYAKGWRKIGLETGGKPIWWNDIRPFHGVTYISFSILNILSVKYAWTILLVDVIIGLLAFINHYIRF
jgi:hypothetical protein